MSSHRQHARVILQIDIILLDRAVEGSNSCTECSRDLLIPLFAREAYILLLVNSPLGVSPRSAARGRAGEIRRHTIIRALGVVVVSVGIARRSPIASLRSHTIPRLVPVCGHAWSASAE